MEPFNINDSNYRSSSTSLSIVLNNGDETTSVGCTCGMVTNQAELIDLTREELPLEQPHPPKFIVDGFPSALQTSRQNNSSHAESEFCFLNGSTPETQESIFTDDDGKSIIFEKAATGMFKITKTHIVETVHIVSEPLWRTA